YRVLNDKRYAQVAVGSSVRQIAFDKCEAELLRLTVGVKRLEGTLCKLRSYEAKGAVSEKEPAENLVIKNEHYTNVSDRSNNTIIASSSTETLSDSEAIDSVPASKLLIKLNLADNRCTRPTQHKMANRIRVIQPDIEFSARQSHQTIEVEQTTDESDVTEVNTDTSACQTEPLNLSTDSHESDSNENVNSDKFYTAQSQNDLQKLITGLILINDISTSLGNNTDMKYLLMVVSVS
ncbi:hypothetical protein CBL_20183, partial [Carabus blaptoides fortunei]